MNASIRAQPKCNAAMLHKQESAMKAVRVNGKITKVKQPQDQPNSKMGDHTFCPFSMAEILGKLVKW